jgi:hypothetical protein
VSTLAPPKENPMTTEYDKLYRVAGRLDIKARFNAKGV